jgi:hypothetical protein
LFDLGPRARVVFAAGWLAVQAALVVTAGSRSEAAFGFRMFPEASTINVHLLRRVASPSGAGTTLVDVSNGTWVAVAPDGQRRTTRWRDRVKVGALATFDRDLFASYGVAAQLARIQAALDDVAMHSPDDAETKALVARVTVNKNGHAPTVVELTSAPR